jgi:hypothetical protein
MPRRVRRRERLTCREAAHRACAGAGDGSHSLHPMPRPASHLMHRKKLRMQLTNSLKSAGFPILLLENLKVQKKKGTFSDLPEVPKDLTWNENDTNFVENATLHNST